MDAHAGMQPHDAATALAADDRIPVLDLAGFRSAAGLAAQCFVELPPSRDPVRRIPAHACGKGERDAVQV